MKKPVETTCIKQKEKLCKGYKSIILASIFSLLAVCCSESEKEEIVVVQPEDLVTEILQNAVKGDTIALVLGTSSHGIINFTIKSQIPDGVFTIAEYGELIVLSDAVSELEVGSKIILEVSVNSGEISEIANIEVTVLPKPAAFVFDIETWVGSLDVAEEGLGSKVVSSSKIDDFTIELGGPDPFDLFCTLENTIRINFGELSSEAEGPITLEAEVFTCWGGEETLTGTGTYNLEEEIISVAYSYGGDFPFSGFKRITRVVE